MKLSFIGFFEKIKKIRLLQIIEYVKGGGPIYFIILLFINTFLFLLYRFFYIIFMLYWLFILVWYYFNKSTYKISCTFYDYSTANVFCYFLYCFVFIKAYMVSFNTIYIFLKNYMENRKTPIFVLLYTFLFNFLIKFITGFSKQVIFLSFLVSYRLTISGLNNLKFKQVLLFVLDNDFYPIY